MKTSSTRSVVAQWKSLCLDAIFPPRCAGGTEASPHCEKWSHDLFCAACVQTLKTIDAPLCDLCGAPIENPHAAAICAQCRDNRYHIAPSFSGVCSVYDYVGAIRPAIHRLKYDGKIALAAPLSRHLIEFLRTSSTRWGAISEIDCIVPIPLHWRRQQQRGFNQSALLAREIGRAFDIPTREMLRRTRKTPPQVELSREERRQNVRGAFAVRDSSQNALRGATTLLIDDVYTTGATISECAQILKNAGAERVYGLTLARSV